MQNAHLRLGLLEYQRMTEKISTRIRVRVDRYVGEGRQAHLLSVFGNDSDVGAITAAVHEKATFTLSFPDNTTMEVSLGERASCYKGAVPLSDRRQPVRHLLAISEELHSNGGAGRTILLRYRREEAWASLVSFLGLPAEPGWAHHVLDVMEEKERIKELDGIGCQPVLLSATTEEVLSWIADGLRSHALRFPEKSGPVFWPQFSLGELLDGTVRTLLSESGSECDV
ncbi:MAG: hypothetical protein HIU91_15580 [Acidobacteria bacterium]|nr:hypothetical protein [Acidobacteriota bacterium]